MGSFWTLYLIFTNYEFKIEGSSTSSSELESSLNRPLTPDSDFLLEYLLDEIFLGILSYKWDLIILDSENSISLLKFLFLDSFKRL